MNAIDREYNAAVNDKSLKNVSDAFNSSSKTKVVVFCYTYNHERYIRDCLDSMLLQNVDFNVQIIVHDDCSTDSTPIILNEYSQKYPNTITVISQKNNLFSKSGNFWPILLFLRKYHDGEYIAMCEGDDFWSDKYKLVTQVRIMDKNKTLSFCTHKVDVMDDNTKNIVRTIPAKGFKLKSGILDSHRFISLTSIRYPFQTSSYFVREKDFSFFLDTLPEFAKLMPTEDESILLFFGQLGKTAYINTSLSVYRKFSVGSWSSQRLNSDINVAIRRLNKMIDSMKQFNVYTNGKYQKECESRIIKHTFRIMLLKHEYDNIFKTKTIRKYFRKKYPRDYYHLLIKRIFKLK